MHVSARRSTSRSTGSGKRLSLPAVVRRKLVIHGRVQGVFFRDTLRRLAEQEEVAGWARNTWEGTVEAVLEGEEGAVDRLVEFARQGPESATVDRVEVSEEEPEGLSGFSIR